MMQRVVFLGIVLTATFTFAEEQTSSKEIQPRTIVIGTELDYPPYSFRGEDGLPTGYNVDLIQAVAKVVGLKVQIHIGSWDRVRNALESGEIDAICGMYYSLEREKQVDFTLPFSVIQHAIFARNDTSEITSEEDLKGKKLIVMRGDIMYDYVVERGLCDDPILAATQASALQRLAAGEGDCALVAKLPGLYWVKQLQLTNLIVIGPYLAPSKYCFAVKNDNFELLSQLNEGLAIVKETGQHRQISDTWFKTLEEDYPHKHFILKYVLMILIPLLVILMAVIVWLWTVRRQVRRATASLRNEIIERQRAEEEIERQARFPAENPNPVLRVDLEGRVLYANKAAAVLLDVWQCRVGEKMPDHCYECIRHAVTTSQIESGECEAGGKTFAMSIAPVIEGGYANLYGMDITERRKAAETLQKEIIRHKTLMDVSLDGIAIINQEHQIIEANRCFADMLGYTLEEVLQLHTWDWQADISEAEIRSAYSDLAQTHSRFETHHRHKNGKIFPVEVSLSGAKIGGDNFVYTVTRDITSRKQAEIALRESETKYRTLVEQAGDAVILHDNRGRILDANRKACENLGYTREELIGKPIQEIDPEAFQTKTVTSSVLDQIFAGKQYRFESRHTRKDGSFFPVEVILGSVNLPVGQAILGIVRDITARKQAEETLQKLNEELEQRVIQRTAELETRIKEVENLNTAMINLSDDLRKTNRNLKHTARGLEVANRELESFSYSVSHDLRAPLRAMDGFSQAILEDYGDHLDETGRDYLNRIRVAAQHMGNLIDAILKLSRASRIEMTSQEVNLSILAKKVVEDLRQSEPDRHVDVTIAPDLSCRGDENLLQQLLANLMENAWKFTSPRDEAKIEFTTLTNEQAAAMSREGQTVYVVRDNGVGFDMHYAAKLFGAFQRLHNREEFPGTGVGLATVQRIVRRHRGEVWAESVMDQGASIYFTLGKS